MLAKLKSSSCCFGAWGLVLVVGTSLMVGLLVWFITSRGVDEAQAPIIVAEITNPVSSVIDQIDQPDALGDFSSKSISDPSMGSGDSGLGFGQNSWQLLSIDGVELSAADATTVRCRVMSTDRIPNNHVVGQLVYQINRHNQLAAADFHISQINNYYRCDLVLRWSTIVVSYQAQNCLDLSRLNGSLSLTTGRGHEVVSHSAWAPWVAAGAGCPNHPNSTGHVSIEVSAGQPPLVEVIYEGTFRVFIPKNDYSQVISRIFVELEPGIYGFLEPVRIERL